MTSESSPQMPSKGSRSAIRPKDAKALDGEVFPPTFRIFDAPRQEASPPPAASRTPFNIRLSTAVLASLLALVLVGGGAFETYQWQNRSAHEAAVVSPTAAALTRLARDFGDLKKSVDTLRQDESVKALKGSVEQLRAEVDSLRSANAASVAQLSAKIEKPEVPKGPALADVVARIDKLDHDPRLNDIAARLDRIERQVSSPTTTATIPTPPTNRTNAAVQQTVVPQQASMAAKPGKPVVLDNWIVRDVYSGIALVEARTGSVREVVPGESLPGAGEVQSIQRHGRRWVVVTSRGVIDTETW